jgi:hypothetical protein
MSERGAPAGHGAAVRVLVVLEVALIVVLGAAVYLRTSCRRRSESP